MSKGLRAMFKFSPSSVSQMEPTLIPSEYGGVNVIPPERPVPEYSKPKQITSAEVCRLLGYTDASEIDSAQAFGFPRAVAFTQTRVGGGLRRTPLYDEDRVREWRERVKRAANL